MKALVAAYGVTLSSSAVCTKSAIGLVSATMMCSARLLLAAPLPLEPANLATRLAGQAVPVHRSSGHERVSGDAGAHTYSFEIQKKCRSFASPWVILAPDSYSSFCRGNREESEIVASSPIALFRPRIYLILNPLSWRSPTHAGIESAEQT